MESRGPVSPKPKPNHPKVFCFFFSKKKCFLFCSFLKKEAKNFFQFASVYGANENGLLFLSPAEQAGQKPRAWRVGGELGRQHRA